MGKVRFEPIADAGIRLIDSECEKDPWDDQIFYALSPFVRLTRLGLIRLDIL